MKALGIALCGLIHLTVTHAQESAAPKLYQKSNLVAWCVVPFDAKKRGPEERAAMIKKLGLRKVAYDWRAEHAPTFEAEILAYKKHGLEFFAFWDWHPSMAALMRKHGIRPANLEDESQPGRRFAGGKNRGGRPLAAATRENRDRVKMPTRFVQSRRLGRRAKKPRRRVRMAPARTQD